MKKLLLTSISLCLCLALLGCSAEEPVPTEEPAATAEPEAVNYEDLLYISELMGKNRSTLQLEDGSFPDWIEIENRSDDVVNLLGWSLRDGDKEGWSFPDVSIAPGEFLLIYADGEDKADALRPDFSLSQGETVSLVSPDGKIAHSMDCISDSEDTSVFADGQEKLTESLWPSPGYKDYDSFARERYCSSPLVINELSPFDTGDGSDWVELKNVSDKSLNAGDYYLSDKQDEPLRWQLPARELAPGEKLMIYCMGEDAYDYNHAPFSLKGNREQLYLSDKNAAALDFVNMHDIPINGSMGRMDGEKGYFYFTKPSPGEDNSGGVRRVSAMPRSVNADGVFENVQSVVAELEAKGTIYYSTDGSVPNDSSNVYSEPLSFSQTTMLRAIAIEDGALPSEPLTLSYIINEGFELPVVSLAVDDEQSFQIIYERGQKDVQLPANVAFYEEKGSFNQRCLVSMKGWTSLSLPKKSLGVEFKSALGGELDYDVFDNGITEYTHLSIRAGQDYISSIFRNELFQQLSLDADSAALTQRSKYCILYVNGQYYGIYCLKEDLTNQFYASHMGVSRDSVEHYRTPVAMDSDFYRDVYEYTMGYPMTEPQHYEHICSIVDMDSLIDWYIFESYCGNTDAQGNVQIFRSPENGNKWSFAFYDLDWGFYASGSFAMIPERYGNNSFELSYILQQLMLNEQFKQQLTERYSELSKTVFTNEYVLGKIDEFAAMLQADVPRDRERWGHSMESWQQHVQNLRDFIHILDYDQHCIDQFCHMLNLSYDERAKWFGE